MFYEPPDNELNINNTFPNNQKRKRKKPFARKKKHGGQKKLTSKKSHSRFAITMSAWAESFTSAATWQLKHQIAYWKSKATALQYENRILHEIIRKNYVNTTQVEKTKSDSENEDLEVEVDNFEENDDEQGEGSDFEVSEEFIQFLAANAKFKEEAKKERERLKALNDPEVDIVKEMEAGPAESIKDRDETLKRLYGKHWQRIGALETSLQSQFISECDSEKPMHWPNIPFNFSF